VIVMVSASWLAAALWSREGCVVGMLPQSLVLVIRQCASRVQLGTAGGGLRCHTTRRKHCWSPIGNRGKLSGQGHLCILQLHLGWAKIPSGTKQDAPEEAA
jgi:hypothetical protein